MRMPTRLRLLTLIGLLSCCQLGCNSGPQRYALRQSQLRAYQLHQQSQALAAERDRAHQSAQAMAAEKARLEQQQAALQQSLDTANRRLENLNAERSTLQERYVSLLNQAKNSPSPLSSDATRRFQELAKKYPEFEFDPQTGVSKFHSDILFESGSAELKSTSQPLLRDFSAILNEGEARRLNILVVGHTDDRPIVKAGTRQQHPTNWHLSTNRANSVVLSLSRLGMKENRMGAAGYSMHQPAIANTNDKARQQNRRVEIFVLAPDAIVAGWDAGSHRN